jgi:L-aminopeptidase/D-esterase-like protein
MSRSSEVPLSSSPLAPLDVPALRFDFPVLRVGVGEYSAGPTGGSLFHFPKQVYAAVDVRGGSTGTTLTDILRTAHGEFVAESPFVVDLRMGWRLAPQWLPLCSSRVGHRKQSEIATVLAAVVFDYKGRDNCLYPDHALGFAALERAREDWSPAAPGAHRTFCALRSTLLQPGLHGAIRSRCSLWRVWYN